MPTLFTIPTKKYRPNQERPHAHQRLKVQLSGRTYIMDLTWIGRLGQWMLDFYDSEENPLILGKILADKANAFEDNYSNPNIPPGALGLFSTVPGTVPSYTNIGRDVKLYYLEF